MNALAARAVIAQYANRIRVANGGITFDLEGLSACEERKLIEAVLIWIEALLSKEKSS